MFGRVSCIENKLFTQYFLIMVFLPQLHPAPPHLPSHQKTKKQKSQRKSQEIHIDAEMHTFTHTFFCILKFESFYRNFILQGVFCHSDLDIILLRLEVSALEFPFVKQGAEWQQRVKLHVPMSFAAEMAPLLSSALPLSAPAILL